MPKKPAGRHTNMIKVATSVQDAVVRADLATHEVEITARSPAETLAEAMRDAGFTPVARAA